MTDFTGASIGDDFEELLKQRLTYQNLKNENKFVNETGDTALSLKVEKVPKDANDVVISL